MVEEDHRGVSVVIVVEVVVEAVDLPLSTKFASSCFHP